MGAALVSSTPSARAARRTSRSRGGGVADGSTNRRISSAVVPATSSTPEAAPRANAQTAVRHPAERAGVEKAERAEPVVHRDHDDLLLGCQQRAVVNGL